MNAIGANVVGLMGLLLGLTVGRGRVPPHPSSHESMHDSIAKVPSSPSRSQSAGGDWSMVAHVITVLPITNRHSGSSTFPTLSSLHVAGHASYAQVPSPFCRSQRFAGSPMKEQVRAGMFFARQFGLLMHSPSFVGLALFFFNGNSSIGRMHNKFTKC